MMNLVFDDPAESWKIASDFLYQALSRNSPTSQNVNSNSSFSQVESEKMLTLFILAARHLNDTSLLHGIGDLINSGRLKPPYMSLDAMIANLEGHFEDAFDLLKDKTNKTLQDRIEFLDSCINSKYYYTKDECHFRHYRDIFESLGPANPYKLYLDSVDFHRNSSLTIVDELKEWLRTWTPVETTQPTSLSFKQSNLNLVIPACLNIPEHLKDYEGRQELFKMTENLLKQQTSTNTLISSDPPYLNKDLRIFRDVLKLLKGDSTFLYEHPFFDYVDLRSYHQLHRHLVTSGLFEKTSFVAGDITGEATSLLELKAVKYLLRTKNPRLANEIYRHLQYTSQFPEHHLNAQILCLTNGQPQSHPSNAVDSLVKAHCDYFNKQKLTAKLIHYLLSQQNCDINVELAESRLICALKDACEGRTPGHTEFPRNSLSLFEGWMLVLNAESYSDRAKVLLGYSSRCRRELSQMTELGQEYREALGMAFKMDADLLFVLARCKQKKFKTEAIKCAGRLLQDIVKNGGYLHEKLPYWLMDEENLKDTLPIWSTFTTNLIHIGQYESSLNKPWNNFIMHLLKLLMKQDPESFLYPVIVSRLDLEWEQEELSKTRGQVNIWSALSKAFNLGSDIKNQKLDWIIWIDKCEHRIAFWRELERQMLLVNPHDIWKKTIVKTEEFIREIRKISFLKGEYLKTLTFRIPKRLLGFLNYFERVWDACMGSIMSSQKMRECEKRLDAVCHEALHHLDKLLLPSSSQTSNVCLTKYDAWFRKTFDKQLKELHYRLNLLVGKKPLILDELDRMVKSIVELMSIIRHSLTRYNHDNRQKLYMELISPKLSRYEPSLVQMPEHYTQSCGSSTTASRTTIHKIKQTIDLISSKNNPKKLTFVGSDGVSRSYLLKAHDDLRLDQLVMSIFSTLNDIFAGAYKVHRPYKLRQYAITPISSRSGLIQWIEAPSLAAKYREWIKGNEGQRVTEELFASTCESVCGKQANLQTRKIFHPNCQVPTVLTLSDLFYQILWAQTKPTGNPITHTKPFSGNSNKYRAEFPTTTFQSVVELLSNSMPDDLLKQSLSSSSSSSQQFWLKTKTFTRSCAAMSMVGYVIGLGDRHPENILLDKDTGEVVHIDFNICFEMGKNLVVPERVPFRLTHTMIRTFGFAGLEGEFRLSCEKILQLLREHKSLLLHLLDQSNYAFMVTTVGRTKFQTEEYARPKKRKMNNCPAPYKSPIGTKLNNKSQSKHVNESNMCSQESDIWMLNRKDVSEILNLSNSLSSDETSYTSDEDESFDIKGSKILHSDPQQNIKTPTKILAHTASNIHKRISDKLSGADDVLRQYDGVRRKRMNNLNGSIRKLLNDKPEEQPQCHDYIPVSKVGQAQSGANQFKTAQTVEDQVEGLIAEAIMIENKAAMYEGWLAWV